MNLNTSILQTKTVGEIIGVLKRATRENTRCAKGILRDAEVVIVAFEKAERKTKRAPKEVLSNRSLTKPYTVNL